MLEPLVNAEKNGVKVTCSDCGVNWIFPILDAYIADHPGQCLVVYVKETPAVHVVLLLLISVGLQCSPSCDPGKTLQTLEDRGRGCKPRVFVDEGLQPVLPFRADLPSCDMFSCITPDIFSTHS